MKVFTEIIVVHGCVECPRRSWSHGIGDFVCGVNSNLGSYSFKTARGLYKKNLIAITQSCPMWPQTVEVDE